MEDFRPPKKRSRFGRPTTSEELEKSSKGFLPKNTEKNDLWAMRVFQEWVQNRNAETDKKDHCPEGVLNTDDAEVLAKWLSLFVMEVRKKDGTEYPPATIHLLLCGLQRIMRRQNSHPFDIFAKKDVRFRAFRGTMESVFHNLHCKGVGANSKHVQVISEEEEELLWENRIMGCHSPRALVRAVFYLNGKNFCLRGGEEHRELKFVQLKRNIDHWTYTEHGSKNYRGGFGDLNRKNKVVKQFPVPDAGDRCHVKLLDLYVSKLPKEAKQKGSFYFTPLQTTPTDPLKPWFTCVPIGRNKLATLVKEMFDEVDVQGKTNHSLRATGATRMFNSGVAEKTIQDRTGHKSIGGLRVYERPDDEQQRKACEVLALPDITNTVASSSTITTQPLSSCSPSGTRISATNIVFNGPVNFNCGPQLSKDTTSQLFSLSQQQLQNFDKSDD